MILKKADISTWFVEARSNGCSHLLITADSSEDEYYPVYVRRGESVKDKIESFKEHKCVSVTRVYRTDKKLDEQVKLWNL